MPRQRRVVSCVPDTKTAKWLDSALRNTNLHNQLKDAISFRLPKSHRVGMSEDHVQNAYLRWLEADALAKHVHEGSGSPSNVRWWAVKSAYKDIREMGREPVLRQMIGARTETDLKNQAKSDEPSVYARNHAKSVVFSKVEGKVFEAPDDSQTNFDVAVDPKVVTMEIDSEDLLDDLRQRLMDSYGTADQHLVVIVAVADGATVAEAADAAGVTTDEAKRMIREIREAMRP